MRGLQTELSVIFGQERSIDGHCEAGRTLPGRFQGFGEDHMSRTAPRDRYSLAPSDGRVESFHASRVEGPCLRSRSRDRGRAETAARIFAAIARLPNRSATFPRDDPKRLGQDHWSLKVQAGHAPPLRRVSTVRSTLTASPPNPVSTSHNTGSDSQLLPGLPPCSAAIRSGSADHDVG